MITNVHSYEVTFSFFFKLFELIYILAISRPLHTQEI